MAEILLFHSVLGLRDLERAAADRLRAAGHGVTLPDLYDAARTDAYDEGFAIRDRIGWEAILARAEAAGDVTPRGAVLAGFSMGAGVAAHLWAGRPETSGVLLLHGLVDMPPAARPGLPLQLHLAEPDPFEDEEFFDDWLGMAERAGLAAEIYRYPGAGHLFTDPALPDHDAEATALLWQRATAFLDVL